MTTENNHLGRFLHVLFADDIRQEVGGKVTIVGIYQSKMIFPSFPVVVPKLAVVMTAVTPINSPFEKLKFLVFKDDEPLQSFEVDAEMLAQAANDVTSMPNEDVKVIEFQFAAVMGALEISGPCVLRTRMETESGIVVGRTLSMIEGEFSV